MTKRLNITLCLGNLEVSWLQRMRRDCLWDEGEDGVLWLGPHRVERTQEQKYTELAHRLPLPGYPGQSPLLGADRNALVEI